MGIIEISKGNVHKDHMLAEHLKNIDLRKQIETTFWSGKRKAQWET